MPNKHNPQRTQQIVALYCENNTLQFVADRFGLTRERIRVILNEAGIHTKIRIKSPKPPKFGKKRITSKERFWSKVDKTGGEDSCWDWIAKTHHSFGYGCMLFNKKYWYSHQLAYYLTYGTPKQWVLHNCGNAKCCNPKHLKDGTPLENAADRLRHGRNNVGKGENHGNAKLNDMKVKEIKTILLTKQLSHSQIGIQFGVSPKTISSISANHTWNHIQI